MQAGGRRFDPGFSSGGRDSRKHLENYTVVTMQSSASVMIASDLRKGKVKLTRAHGGCLGTKCR